MKLDKLYVYFPKKTQLKNHVYLVDEEVTDLQLFFEHIKSEFKEASQFLVSISGDKHESQRSNFKITVTQP